MLLNLIKNFLASPYDFLVGTFFNVALYLRALKINVLVFVFVLFIFIGPSQSIDLFNGLAMDGLRANLIFWCSITLLSIMMWYTSIHFLIRYDLTSVRDEYGYQKKVVPSLPFLAGISTYFIALYGFNRGEVVDNSLGVFYLVGGVIVILGVTYLRDILTKKFRLMKGEEMLKILRAPVNPTQKWTFLSRLDKFLILAGTSLYFGAIIIILILSFLDTKPVYIPLFFQASTIICLFFSGLLMLLLFLWSALGYRVFKISVLLFFLLATLFSSYNNNHAPRLLEAQALSAAKEQDFSSWLKERYDTTKYNRENKIPVYFIAAEGGGIRSMKWTALVLDKLYAAQPDFGNHLYGLSGVSGGSVGIVFQQAALPFCPNGCAQKLNTAVSQDFLSPVTMGLLVPDLFAQSIIPFPINKWDRSQWLEDSWQYSFQKSFGSPSLNEDITGYWATNNLPNVYLNCTA